MYRTSKGVETWFRTPYPLIDPLGRVIGVLAGTPGSGYAEDLLRASDLILQEGKQAGLGAAAPNPHLRSSFPAYNCGITMGMGSPCPVALNPKALTVVLVRLVGHETVLQMAMYQNRAFSIWAPRVYAVYEATQTRMYEELPTLSRNFPGSVFSAAAFNFGGNVWTYKHRDHLNWPFGWCAITALGRFDPARSAQLILWELKLVIDFPHAATILIPSAVITHSNTPVAEGDI
ncbi:uncharacterized protein C8R40DRAFT_1178816 [Lentinula edodes]|uniref:uncharacterized protein n=1 Tax=Lentinula edodes TaxID=5353 RepID=UPI001E8EB0F1|nr:uncharacterized protein C8R40DRAFT_1178816 [Lentinula edodes]KAH7867666.1 hypothetical protein C8R40DRAFT_1178816 [Lentinula edodes]